MKMTTLRARDVLSFAALELTLNEGLTVITGPNGSGKTSLGRLISVMREAVRACAHNDWSNLTTEYEQAGRYGASEWEVRVGLLFDRPDEQELLDDWVHSSLVSALTASQAGLADQYDRLLTQDLRSSEVFGAGELVVRDTVTRNHPWEVVWECIVGGAPIRMELWNGHRLGPRTEGPGAGRASLNFFEWLRTRGDSMAAPAAADRPSEFTLVDLAPAGDLELVARPTGLGSEPASFQRLKARLGQPLSPAGPVLFAHVLDHLLFGGLLMTANQRAPVQRQVAAKALGLEPDLVSGSGMPLALWQDKNGDAFERARFRDAQRLFTALTVSQLDVRAQPLEDDTVLIVPVIEHEDTAAARTVDIPLHLSGAGKEESALLATLLSRAPSVMLLDEPATNLSAAAQHQLLTQLRARTAAGAQTILITHSGHLVPATEPADLASLIRLTQEHGATNVHRPTHNTHDFPRIRTLLRMGDLRDLLFASGVLLVEGATDQEALEVWLSTSSSGLPTPEGAHVSIVSVGGDQNFAAYVRLVRELGVRWAALADGPAFRAGKALDQVSGGPPQVSFGPANPETFAPARSRWHPYGVYTLATDFFDDGSKGGEIEAYFHHVDSVRWAQIKGRGKVRQGAAFAAATPTPSEVVTLWRDILGHLRLR